MKFNIKVILLSLGILVIGVLLKSFYLGAEKEVVPVKKGGTRRVMVAPSGTMTKKRNVNRADKIKVSELLDANGKLQKGALTKEVLDILADETIDESNVTMELINILAQLTSEQRMAIRMRQRINSSVSSPEARKDILRLARGLMDSKDAAIRRMALESLSWVGLAAMPELTEMLSDPDPIIARDALQDWQRTFDEIGSEQDKTELLLELLPTLTEREQMDAALMSVTRMRTEAALETVSEIIEANRGHMVEDAAQEMWEHLTGGGTYENANSVTEYVERRQQEVRDAMEQWREVMAALAVGDEVRAREILGLPAQDVEQNSENKPIENKAIEK